MESLYMRVVGFTTKVEFLKGEVEQASDEARGLGVQASFKVFRQLMLQLHLDFYMEALEDLVTPANHRSRGGGGCCL